MATLKSLVDETANIRNEIVECYSNLKNNLVDKGVECSDSDKLSNLIYKVCGLSIIKEPVLAGLDFLIVNDFTQYSTTAENNGLIFTSPKIKLEGSYRVRFTGGSVNGIVVKYGVKHIRNGSVIKEEMVNWSGYMYATYTYDFNNVKKGDYFEFYAYANSIGSYLHMKDISVGFECKL